MMGFNLTPMVKNLLIINLLMFVLSIFVLSQFNINLNMVLGLYNFSSEKFHPVQIFTHMFMHSFMGAGGISIMHILSNMFALFMFGPMLENVWGAKRFLLYYLICGLGAALIHSSIMYYDLNKLETAKDNFLTNPTTQNLITYSKEHGQINTSYVRQFQENETSPSFIEQAKNDVKETYKKMTDVPMVGASGAVFGILLGYGMLFPNTVLMLLFPPIPIKAKYFVLFYGLFELYSGVHVIPGDNVAHFAHLGGMLFGFFMIKYWQRQRNTFY